MLGLWLENKKITLRDDLLKPIPTKNEVLIKVLMSGICNTDIELTKGYYPYTGVLGHEFVGIVEPDANEFTNKRVVGEINAICEECENCSIGLKNHCSNRTVLGIVGRNGSFTEYLTLPVRNIYTVPETVSTEQATFTEPLAAALQIQQQINIRPEDKVLVIGDGKLGNLVVQTLLLRGCEVWLIGRYDNKIRPLEKLGAIRGNEKSVKKSSFNIVIECTGNSDGIHFALQAIKPRGILVMKSTYSNKLLLDSASIVVKELTLIGSRCGPFLPALNLLEKKLINTDILIEETYPLTEAIKAFEHANRKGAKKILIKNN